MSLPLPFRLAAVLLAAALTAISGCGSSDDRLNIVAAASLRLPLEDLAGRFEAAHPGVDVRLQTGGSNSLARRVRELDLAADLVALADGTLFEEVLRPEWTDFHVTFATNRLVLAHTSQSRGAEDLETEGWAEVLGREEVTVAMADADLAPVGYRTLLALRLYDLDHPGAGLQALVRSKVGRRHLRPSVADLLAPLEAGAVDYAFVYASVAMAAGLPYLDLPPEIDLGDPSRADAYARATVETAGRVVGQRVVRRGAPIAYAAATRAGASEAARQFLALLLSAEGESALSRSGFAPLAGGPRWYGPRPPG